MGYGERTNPRNLDRKKYTYGEAFMLMNYACKNGHREVLWNSRDGITPFCIRCLQCEETADHVEWNKDQRVLDFNPLPGMRVFVDLTPERAREYRREFVEKYWGEDMAERWPTKEAAVEELAEADLGSFAPHTPDILTVQAWPLPVVDGDGEK